MLMPGRGEEGQVIVLFVVMFSVVLLMAGFAIDQGYWYGRRRVVQKDADLAARSGALVYIGNRSDQSGAESRARQTARDNGATGGIVTDGSATCAGIDDGGNALQIAAPSIEVRLLTEARGFFTALNFFSNSRDSIEVGASATACVGRVTRLYVANGDDPLTDDNTLKGIPIALRNDVSGPTPNSCFSGTTLILGQECVIYGPKTAADGVDDDDADERRMLFTAPSPGNCDGGGWNSVTSEIRDMEDGLAFTCSVNPSNSCAGTVRRTSCVSTENINQDQNQERVFEAMQARLNNANGKSDCDSREGGEPEQSFQNAFGNGDGESSLAPDPPPLGGTASAGHVYVQNDCYGNPRIVVLPIVSGGSDDLDERPVRGFATVYITGCYHQDDPGSVAERERNDCSVSGGNNDAQRNQWLIVACGNPIVPQADCRWEIRGIPVHVFVSAGSLGGIDPPSPNAPLTIQTVE